MAAMNWPLFRSSVEAIPAWGIPVDLPTDHMLDNYESACGFRLPADYRQFIKAFGPGQLANEYTIRSPGYLLSENIPLLSSFSFQADLGYFNRKLRDEGPLDRDTLVHCFPQDMERLERMIYFADTTLGEIIGWDPEDIQRTGESEYGVYILLRERTCLSFLTNQFSKFVLDVCFGTRYGELVSPSAIERWIPPKSFRPMALPQQNDMV